MNDIDAINYAASWGSYIRAGDPGSCMYGFSPPNFTVQSEDHRQRCLEHMVGCRDRVLAAPGNYDEEELTRLDAFLARLITAPINE